MKKGYIFLHNLFENRDFRHQLRYFIDLTSAAIDECFREGIKNNKQGKKLYSLLEEQDKNFSHETGHIPFTIRFKNKELDPLTSQYQYVIKDFAFLFLWLKRHFFCCYNSWEEFKKHFKYLSELRNLLEHYESQEIKHKKTREALLNGQKDDILKQSLILIANVLLPKLVGDLRSIIGGVASQSEQKIVIGNSSISVSQTQEILKTIVEKRRVKTKEFFWDKTRGVIDKKIRLERENYKRKIDNLRHALWSELRWKSFLMVYCFVGHNNFKKLQTYTEKYGIKGAKNIENAYYLLNDINMILSWSISHIEHLFDKSQKKQLRNPIKHNIWTMDLTPEKLLFYLKGISDICREYNLWTIRAQTLQKIRWRLEQEKYVRIKTENGWVTIRNWSQENRDNYKNYEKERNPLRRMASDLYLAINGL